MGDTFLFGLEGETYTRPERGGECRTVCQTANAGSIEVPLPTRRPKSAKKPNLQLADKPLQWRTFVLGTKGVMVALFVPSQKSAVNPVRPGREQPQR